MSEHLLTEALYRALNSEYGIVLTTTDPDKLRQKLYTARRKLEDPNLAILSFATSRTSPESELLIVKGSANVKE